MKIKDSVIIITGASQGIGLATAKLLAQRGAKIVLAARSLDTLNEIAKEMPEAIAVQTDMRNPEDIKKLINKTIEKYGRIDVLINNAGQGMYSSVENTVISDYKNMMELNIYAVLEAMQTTIPHMRKQGGGMILNISSMVSKNFYPDLAAYASTKYALNALSLTARTELEKDNIIVSVFHPKMTATEFGKNALGTAPDWSTRGGTMPQVDTAEQVAEKIADQIESEEPESMM